MKPTDARRTRIATITEADHAAISCSPTRCVVANAIRRWPGVVDVRVGASVARVTTADALVRYDLDNNTRAAIRSYDAAGQLPPAGFRARLIPPARSMGGRRGTRPGSNRRSGEGSSVATRRPSLRHIDREPSA